MIINPKTNQEVQVWYRKEARHFPYHGKYGRVFATSSGKPRNIGVIIEGVKVIVPCGNLREPKDANGKPPAKRTNVELQWHDVIKKGEVQKRYDALKRRQALPLKEKIELSQERIKEWHEAFNGKVAVSFSGGKDSAVLLWLVRSLFPNTPAVFCNTGLEYPDLVKLVRNTPNVAWLRPKMHFSKVIRKYGYPLISKKVARGVNVLKHPTGNNQNIYRLYDEGINRYGEPVHGFKLAQRWRFLIDAPFEISDKCCQIMKKDPMKAYTKETGFTPFVGIMADDSKQRQKIYMRNGCNAFDTKEPKSWPMAFWTKQDVLKCIKQYRIQIPSVYGDIVRCETSGKLKTTGVSSTGCIYCAFGVHMEETPNRFQQMNSSDHRLWKYTVNRLGLGDMFEYIRRYCPDRKVAEKFHASPRPVAEQIALFT